MTPKMILAGLVLVLCGPIMYSLLDYVHLPDYNLLPAEEGAEKEAGSHQRPPDPPDLPDGLCVSTDRQFTVLRYERETTNRYFVEVQDWVLHGLRGHGVDVNTRMWPSCLDHAPDHPESCLGRACVVTFACTSNMKVEPIVRTVQAGHGTSVVQFQLEVVGGQPRPCFDDPGFLPLWRQAAVWDYSTVNMAALARTGLLSYAPAWARPAVVHLTSYPGISGDPADDLRPPERQRFDQPYTYDVLLLMGMNPRREAILRALQQRSLTVHYPQWSDAEGWGSGRVALVRSAALLLNVHQYGVVPSPLEAPRLIFLLSLGASVLSEDTTDLADMARWADGVEFVPYDQLADSAVRLLANATRRYELAAAGFRAVRRVSPRDAIKSALMAALDSTNSSYSLQACPP